MKELGRLLLSIIGLAILLVLIGFMVAFAYNQSIPYIFGLPTIDIGKGLALFILFQILFLGRFEFKTTKKK